MEKKMTLVLGGDERQYYLAKELKKAEFDVKYIEEKQMGEKAELDLEIQKSSLILLPMAAKEELLTLVLNNLHKGQKIYGGVLKEFFCKGCKDKGVIYYDYMKDNGIAIKNAVATAEGAIAEAIMLSKINLHNSKCLVIGFGRCGEILADKLKGLKCDVSVMVRKEEAKAKAEAYGYSVVPCSAMKGHYGCNCEKNGFHFIFNTAPALLVDRQFLEEQKASVTIIDIASSPGGVDYTACKELGIMAKNCLSLPGKYAPKTSARILAETIILKEQK